MQQAKPVVGYIRVSTVYQAERGLSLEAQRAMIQDWARARGHGDVRIYADEGISGKRADNRPGLKQALLDATSTSATFVVYSLSRLARNTKETLEIGTLLEKSGADLVSLSESIDTTSAMGKMIFRMLAVLAELERDLASERSTAVLAHKRSKGERTGSVPYGYRAVGKVLVLDDNEQVIVSMIRSRRERGDSLRRIVRELNEARVQARGKEWHLRTVQRILANA